MTGRSLLRAAAALLLAGGGLLGLAGPPEVPDQVYPNVPAFIDVPSGSSMRGEDGRDVQPLSVTRTTSETMPGGETWALPVLLPGSYQVTSPALWVGGRWRPSTFEVVVVAPRLPPGSSGYPAENPLPGILLLLGSAVLAGASQLVPGRAGAGAGIVAAGAAALYAGVGTPTGALTAASVGAAVACALGCVLLWVGARPLALPGRGLAAAGVASGVVAALTGGTIAALAAGAMAAASLLPWSTQGPPQGPAQRKRSVAAVVSLCVLTVCAAMLAAVPPAAAGAGQALGLVSAAPQTARLTPTACQRLYLSESSTQADGVACWTALGAQAGAGAGVPGAHEALADALATGKLMPAGVVCRPAGDAAAAAAAAQLADPAAGLVSVSSLCDFTGVHGVLIAVVAAAADPLAAVKAACEGDGPPGMPGQTFVTQCWHGAGQGVARVTGFDWDAITELCVQSGEPGATSNCGEGAFAELADDVTRGQSGERFRHERTGRSVTQVCLDVDERIVNGCFRYVGADYAHLGPDPGLAAARLAVDCQRTLPGSVRERSCWSGVGSLASNWADADDVLGSAGRAARMCEGAPPGEFQTECIVRVISNHVFDGVSVDQVEQMCALLPAAGRAGACTGLLAFQQSLAGEDVRTRQ